MHQRRRTKSARGKVFVLGAAGLILWAALLAWALLGAPPEVTGAARTGSPAGASPGGTAAQHQPRPDVVGLNYQYDITDERFVIGLSENVFTGRVEEPAGREPAETSIPGDSRPQTQYAVTVLEIVKSSGPSPLSPGDKATVNREGGISPKTGEEQVVDAHSCGAHILDAPLRAGAEYLFAAYYEPARDLHTLVAQPTGAVPVSSPEEREALVAAYEEAARDQKNPMLDPEAEEGSVCD